MNLNIFFGVYILVFAIVIFIVWYFLYVRKNKKYVRCTEKTTGKVVRYSIVRYNDISLPVVEYVVDGKSYNAVGPHFRGVVKFSFQSPFNKIKTQIKSNLTTREELPETLKLNVKRNNLVSYEISPLLDLYPIGSKVFVYYNPLKPKESYVERFLKPSKWLNLILLLAIILVGLSIYVFFFLK